MLCDWIANSQVFSWRQIMNVTDIKDVRPSSLKKLSNVEDIYPLSPMQQGMLFHSILDSSAQAYVTQMAFRIDSRVNVQSFRRAWEEVVRRHTILRTAFVWENLKEPMQVVRKNVELPWREEDWSSWSEAEQEEKWRTLLEEDRKRGFDLKRAPLLRFGIVKIGEGRYYFSLSRHHILFDASCANILIQELIALYEAYRAGKKLQLDAPSTYRNYIGWLLRQDQEKAESFWRAELKGFTSPTRMAIIREKDRVEETGHGTASIEVGQDLTTRLHTLARAQQITLNTVVQGAWALLLSRYSEELDVVFGSTFLGRPAQVDGIESMVGLFFNTLPLRVKTLEGESVEGYLKRLQLRLAEIRRYEYSSLLNVQQWSDMPSGTPLFNYLVDVQKSFTNADAQGNPNTSLRVAVLGTTGMIDFPLALVVGLGTDLQLGCEYAPGQLDSQDIDRMLRHLETILQAFVKAPEQVTTKVSLLSDAERRQIVEEWNATAQEYEDDPCLHELFERQVERTPESVALEYAGQELTYGELDRRTNQLGHYLRRMGVGPEVRVGICVERSLEMVVGMLGILKAGGAYVALDPGYPAERLGYMLGDSGASVVVTQERLAGQLPGKATGQAGQVAVVCLDQEWEEKIGKESGRRLAGEVGADNLSYIYYTSGSTGRPKGVAIAHRGIVNYMRWGVEGYRAREGSGAGVHSSIAVDLTLTNFLPLFVGQRMELVREGPGVEGLVEVMKGEPGWSLLKITPTHLTLLNPRLTEREMCASTRVLVIGADNLVAEPTLVWREKAPGVMLLNEYGPTETVVGCSVYRIGGDAPRRGGMPIGKPIWNMTMYVLDGEGEPAPVGVAGELYIGGVGVARGYWGKPELTAERFVPDRYAGSGARFYRTGDRARFLRDGNLEFLGRVDHQVKIRGYRIELEEIEAVMSGCAGVHKAMVVVREDEPGEKRLVGYVAAPGGVEVKELREYLKERLPDYMIPVAFVVLEELPVRSSGKIDPKDLPTPEMGGEEERYVEARTEVERVLVRIWEEVLGVERVGVHDNFFELGGDSILSVRVLTRAQREGIHLTTRQMFERQTIAELAQVAGSESQQGAAPKSVAPQMKKTESEGVLPLSHAQQRLWFIDKLDPGNTAYNISIGARLNGYLDKKALLRSLNEIVRRHEVLRTSFPVINDEPVQKIATEPDLVITETDLAGWGADERQAEVERIARAESSYPFDLARGPLLRMKLLRLGEQEYVLLVTTHHIVFDGWSGTVMIQELIQLYSAFARGEPSPLPDLEIQYADFALWERTWLQGVALEEHLAYWRRQLADLPVLELPLDRPRPPIKNYRGASLNFELGRDLTLQMQELSEKENATIFMIVVAAFQMILSKYSGQQDVSLGVVIANRNRLEFEKLIGVFVNTLVIRTLLDPDLSFRALLWQVRQTTLDAYQNTDMPFEKVVQQALPGRDMDRTPFFKAMLAFQNLPKASSEVSGPAVEMLLPWNYAVRSDMDLYVTVDQEMLYGNLIYDVELFNHSTVLGMLKDLQNLLANILSQPDASLLELMFHHPHELPELI
jgi:amino acid adenylation domain-containing protein